MLHELEYQRPYIKGIALASGGANLPVKTFLQDCPYTLEDVLSDRFYPGEPATDEMMNRFCLEHKTWQTERLCRKLFVTLPGANRSVTATSKT